MKSPTVIVYVKWNIIEWKYKVGDWSEKKSESVSRLEWINSINLKWKYNGVIILNMKWYYGWKI